MQGYFISRPLPAEQLTAMLCRELHAAELAAGEPKTETFDIVI